STVAQGNVDRNPGTVPSIVVTKYLAEIRAEPANQIRIHGCVGATEKVICSCPCAGNARLRVSSDQVDGWQQLVLRVFVINFLVFELQLDLFHLRLVL